MDGSKESEAILELVVALRASLKPETVLVRVAPGDGDPGSPELAEASLYLERLRGRLSHPDGPSVTTRTLHGRPADAITSLAREVPDALIVMTTRGRSGISRAVLGSVCDRVVRTAGVPVLVAQPGAEWRPAPA